MSPAEARWEAADDDYRTIRTIRLGLEAERHLAARHTPSEDLTKLNADIESWVALETEAFRARTRILGDPDLKAEDDSAIHTSPERYPGFVGSVHGA